MLQALHTTCFDLCLALQDVPRTLSETQRGQGPGNDSFVINCKKRTDIVRKKLSASLRFIHWRDTFQIIDSKKPMN
jgi:hypothetical protein